MSFRPSLPQNPYSPMLPPHQPTLDDTLWKRVLNYNPGIKNRKDVLWHYADTYKNEFVIAVKRKLPALVKIFPDKVNDDSGTEYKIRLQEYRYYP